MATAQEYPNSDASQSGKNAPFFSQKQLEQLIRRLEIPHYLRRTFEIWWRVCTAPDGREIQLFESLPTFARAAQICERTARNHFRKFERLELMEIAVRSDGKRLVANSIRKSATYRLKTETLARNHWPECKRCGHKHAASNECGCSMGERKGRFRTKGGGILRKIVSRTCRCKASMSAPIPFRPSRSSHSSPSPAQERAASPTSLPPATAAPVPAAAVQQRETSRPPRRLTSREGPQLVAKVAELMRGYHGTVNTVSGLVHVDESHPKYRAPMSQEHALTAACMTLGIPYEAAMEHLKLCRWKFDEPAP